MIVLDDHNLAYVSVPKCACTSAKELFFEIENGFPFRQFSVSGVVYGVHKLARSVAFEALPFERIAGYFKVALVRDTVSRIYSCYRDKILGGRAFQAPADRQAAVARGLAAEPSFDAFVDRLEDYRALSPVIRHHSQPLSHFLGPDPDWFGRIFDLSQAEDFAALVRERTGRDAAMPHRNPSLRDDTSAGAISASAAARIRSHYAEDYDLFGAWFTHREPWLPNTTPIETDARRGTN